MATSTATRAADTFPVYQGFSGQTCTAYGFYDLASDPTTADIIEFCKLPKGAVVVGGFLELEKALDSGGSETFECDIGWAGATTALLNSGVITTTLRHHFTAVNATTGVNTTTAETTVIGTLTTAATFTSGGGYLYVRVDYTMP